MSDETRCQIYADESLLRSGFSAEDCECVCVVESERDEMRDSQSVSQSSLRGFIFLAFPAATSEDDDDD